MNFNDRLQAIKNECVRREAIKEKIVSEIDTLKAASSELQKKIEITDKSKMIVSDISISAKKNVVSFLEKVVTDAIQYIAGTNYSFKIDLDDSGKNIKCEFYIVEMVNGVESKQDPKDACGGGFVDIISVALRYAYVNLFNCPKLSGWMMLDEPGKMVSSNMSSGFGEFIKRLGQDFNRQTIMVSHNTNLLNIGDNIIEVSKGVVTVV